MLVLSRGGFRVNFLLIDADRYTLMMRDEKGKVADGPFGENLGMLEALNSKNAKGAKEQKRKVEDALQTANKKLQELRMGLEAEIQRSKEATAAAEVANASALRGPLIRPSSRQGFGSEPMEYEEEVESPTFILSDILEALDEEVMKPEYYVENMNRLVELLKRYPSLRYDLAWQIFGLRIQTMLLSESSTALPERSWLLRRYTPPVSRTSTPWLPPSSSSTARDVVITVMFFLVAR